MKKAAVLAALLIALPVFAGNRNIDITKTGAKPGLEKDNAPAIQKAIDKAAAGSTILVAPGEYQYKFVIDGTWCADPENANAVPNDQGTYNSVITVK